MRPLTYFLLNIKRCLKRPAILILLMLFPLLTFFFFQLGGDREETLSVYVYTEAAEGFPAVLVEKLTGREGVVTFLRADSRAQLSREIAAGNAECGYLIPADLLEKLRAGQKRGLIEVEASQGATLTGVTNEIVFAKLFEEYVAVILADFLADHNVEPALPLSELDTLYRHNLESSSIFSFEYTGKYASYSGVRKGLGIQVFKGFTAILILIGGFLGILNHAESRESRIFNGISENKQKYLLLADTLVPVLLTMTAGLLTLAVIGAASWSDLLRLFGYSLLVTVFCILLFFIVRRKTVILFLIPFYLLGCMVFTPIIIDITMFVPALKPVCMLFLPYYFC